MTTRSWAGGTGKYGVASNWSPGGVPKPGDTALVAAGTVITGARVLQGVSIELQGSTTASEPVLAFYDTVLNATITLGTASGASRDFGEIRAHGLVVSEGTILDNGRFTSGGDLTIAIARNSSFENTGTISVGFGAPLQVETMGTGAVFANFGAVVIDGGTVDVNAPVIGTGTFQHFTMGESGANLTFEQSVAQGTTVDMQTGSGFGTSLDLDKPMQFLGTITNFDGYMNSIGLPDQAVTALTFAHDRLTCSTTARRSRTST